MGGCEPSQDHPLNNGLYEKITRLFPKFLQGTWKRPSNGDQAFLISFIRRHDGCLRFEWQTVVPFLSRPQKNIYNKVSQLTLSWLTFRSDELLWPLPLPKIVLLRTMKSPNFRLSNIASVPKFLPKVEILELLSILLRRTQTTTPTQQSVFESHNWIKNMILISDISILQRI